MRPWSECARGPLWLAVACGVLAISAPVATTQGSQAESKQKAVPPTASAQIPAHLRDIRRELSGMLAAIDPATGELRAPSADERAELAGSTAASSLSAPQPEDLPGGGSLLLTSAANIDFTTAVVTPDGKVTFRCTHGFDPASSKYAAQHRTLPREVRHDR